MHLESIMGNKKKTKACKMMPERSRKATEKLQKRGRENTHHFCSFSVAFFSDCWPFLLAIFSSVSLLGAFMAQKCRTRVPKVLPFRPQGAPRRTPSHHLGPANLTKRQKHMRISLFQQCHHDGLLDTSGHYCCGPGPLKGIPQQPRGPPRSPKPPILRQYVAHFSQLVSLGPQERSQDLQK